MQKMMHKNKVWIGFLLIIAAISLIFLFKAGVALIQYYKKSEEVPVKIENIFVSELKKGMYGVLADFTYQFKDEEFKGRKLIAGPYQNVWAAESGIKKISNEGRSIWVDPNNHETATFIKKFPFKSIFSALILLGLTLYFFSLGLVYGRREH